MRHDVTVVFQNIDGDGVPTQVGDIVALVECPEDLSRIHRWSLPDHRLIREEMNYRVAAFVDERVVKHIHVKSVLVHKSRSRPRSPRRTLLVIDCEIYGVRVRIIIGHAVNSAWAPWWKPTTYRKARRALWNTWDRHVTQQVEEGHDEDRLVFVLADANRARGRWGFKRMIRRISHGPDVVFSSAVHPHAPLVGREEIGAKTGNGRVTHNSIKFPVVFFLPDPK